MNFSAFSKVIPYSTLADELAFRIFGLPPLDKDALSPFEEQSESEAEHNEGEFITMEQYEELFQVDGAPYLLKKLT